ncbi:MAG: DUF1566 domain-containing protein [Ramlibacter sp.]
MNTSTPILTPPAHGIYWPGQGGLYIASLPARDGAPARHLIASQEELEHAKYGPYINIAGANSHHNGRTNTAALLASGHDHPAASWAHQHQADGHADFHLPSQAELMACYVFAPEAFNPKGWYWSSTQGDSHNAFAQNFAYGFSFWGNRGSELRVRAVRWIQL